MHLNKKLIKLLFRGILVIISISQSTVHAQNEKDFLFNLSTKVRELSVLMVIPIAENNMKSEVCISNTDLFNYIFKKYYYNEHSMFSNFVYDIFNGKILIKKNMLHGILTHKIDSCSNILSEYEEFGYSYITEKYLERNKNRLVTKVELDTEDYYGLIMIMFNKNYYIIEGDYQGELAFYFHPLKK